MNALKKSLILFLILLTLFLSPILVNARDLFLANSSATQYKQEGVRLVFFADLHFQDAKGGIQTDIGSPSYKIPRHTKKALNSVAPDYIFGLGDLTTHSEPEEWSAYREWLSGLKAPVFDLLGNHDRKHLNHKGSYGKGYFTKLNRTSATKVLKMGNNVFILLSEAHNPERDGNKLASTIPDKRLDFVEKYLERFNKSNIFILSHTPIPGTTAFSSHWFSGENEYWKNASSKLLRLIEEHDVVGHITGHVHIDYRMEEPFSRKGKGKFVSGSDLPGNLSGTYFLNMPVVDYAHGWVGSHFPVLIGLGNFLNKKRMNFHQVFEDKGLPITDALYAFLGRSAIYYMDFAENQREIEVITRWVKPNSDVESYKINTRYPIELGNGELNFIASDLSLRGKDNLKITNKDWFMIKAGESGRGNFSKKFRNKTVVRGAKIKARNLKRSFIRWKGSKGEKGWSEWKTDPQDLGRVNAVLIEVKFESGEKPSYIRDMKIK